MFTRDECTCARLLLKDEEIVMKCFMEKAEKRMYQCCLAEKDASDCFASVLHRFDSRGFTAPDSV